MIENNIIVIELTAQLTVGEYLDIGPGSVYIIKIEI
jgi:hypothetical protein